MLRELLAVYVCGTPKGQPRPRAFSRGGHARVYDPGTAEGWKGEIALAVRPWAGKRFTGPLQVTLEFQMPRPKNHFNRAGIVHPWALSAYHTQKPDIDNLAKAVFDCLTAVGVWVDDAQVWSAETTREWAPPGFSGCQIRVMGDEL